VCRFADLCFVAVAHGWNTDCCNLLLVVVVSSTPVPFWGGVERAGVVGGGLWVRCWVLRERAVACCLGWAGWCLYCLGCLGWRVCGAGFGLLFEICIVDASIFFSWFCV
jgi:hypothetical protein